jgi:hypothetical protein
MNALNSEPARQETIFGPRAMTPLDLRNNNNRCDLGEYASSLNSQLKRLSELPIKYTRGSQRSISEHPLAGIAAKLY